MRRSLGIFIVVLALACPVVAAAGVTPTVWTDGNGDGLPDGVSFAAAFQTNVSMDIWIDSQSYTWTGYQAWVQRGGVGTEFSFVSGTYIISGGTNFSIDNFTNPYATGFAGFGFSSQHGVVKISNLVLRTEQTGVQCVHPIIDIADPYGTFCVLSTQTTYQLFFSQTGTCWDVSGGTATQATTWGQIKGLFE